MLDEELLATQALPCQDEVSLACFSRSSIRFTKIHDLLPNSYEPSASSYRSRVAHSKSDATKPVDMLDELAEQFSARYNPTVEERCS